MPLPPPPPISPAQQELLQLTDKTESNIRAVIRAWLKEGGADISSEWRTSAGPIDLYLKNRRVIIETKKPSRLTNGPEALGTSSADETALEQLERYVLAERLRERLYLEDGIEDLPWIGVITDGRKWWIYEWSSDVTNNAYSVNNAWNGTILTRTNLDSLTKIFDRKIGLEWAPDDPTSLFDDHLETLRELHDREAGKPSLDTMKELWLRQLKASGSAPENKYDETELFILHTLLISVSSLIVNSIMEKDEPRLGFSAWVSNSGWLEAVRSTINNYNWRQGTGDVLRALYMGLVDGKHRKIYGEFYTPDWLAELLCLEVLDDKWIQKCIDDHHVGKYSGVLDPACGSGTFLYHAAKRIIESKPVKNANMMPEQLSEMLVKLVNGIDIHPVAVEMSRANLLRVLPTIPNGGLRIWQGDSLQTDRKDSKQITLFEEDDDSLTIYSRKNNTIHLPKSFLSRSTVIDDVERLVESANNKKSFPVGLDAGLNDPDAKMLKKTHNTLTKICIDEGNSVWAWYILNRAGPFILSKEKVSRIVANPPWVKISNVRDMKRKKEIVDASKTHDIWAGGKNAANFDIASLFVIKCSSLYLRKSDKSGWVLPQAALRGGNWEKYLKKMGKYIRKSWDLDSLPFPTQSKSCINMLYSGSGCNLKKLEKLSGEKIKHYNNWNEVSKKTIWKKPPRKFIESPSKYPTSLIKRGTMIYPNCLVVIDTVINEGTTSKITTKASRHGIWKTIGVQNGVVPSHWVQEFISSNDLLPYMINKQLAKGILPLNKSRTNFENNPMQNEYWRDAEGLYQKYMKDGSTKTLLKTLDYQNILTKQIKRESKYAVIYNTSGTWLCASRIPQDSIISSAYYVFEAKSVNEALFLTALLNADCLQNAYQFSRKTDRHFHMHFWQSIPLPRYNKSNELHVKLAKLAIRAEKAAKSCPTQKRKSIREFLREDGVSGEIDEIVKELLPEYAT